MLRLRIQDQPLPALKRDVGLNVALIRELHIFGPELALTQHHENAAQHKGLGRALLTEAERIARDQFQRNWIAILSGVGAREYYRAEGYELQGAYMVKNISASRS
jgi:elongator complex protein 3